MKRAWVAGQRSLRDLSFRDVAILPEWVRDQAGRREDLVLMHQNLDGLWQRT
jgi:hypothetical protein